MLKIKRALISVSQKDQELLSLAKFLDELEIEIYASDGTKNFLAEKKIRATSTSELTGFSDLLGGRLKTLDAKIFAGVLARKDVQADALDLAKLQAPNFDLVVVDLYHFQEKSTLEQIDIGGASLLRAAAKNYQNSVVLSQKEQYSEFISLYSLGGGIPEKARLEYAALAFKLSSDYDRAVYHYLDQTKKIKREQKEQKEQNLELICLKQVNTLRYGENPHQKAKLFQFSFSGDQEQVQENSLENFKKLQGKELSYNNWLDIDAAWNLIREFEREIPACAIIKHGSACGLALGEDLLDSYQSALDCDPVSAFGGVVVFNQTVDKELALKIKQFFLEIIVAPDFSEESSEILGAKKNLRLVTYPRVNINQSNLQGKVSSLRSVCGNGLLLQEQNTRQVLDPEELKVVTSFQPSKEDWLQLLLASRVVKHLSSNAIVVVKENRTVGIAAGQSSRLDAVRLSLEKGSDLSSGAVLASDGFFPFPDSVELAAQSRIRAIIQPGGSIRDELVIKAAEKYKIALVLTGIRAFKH